MTKKHKVTYYVYHSGSGTLINADDGVTVFSDEAFTNDEREALDDGDTLPAEGAGVRLMTLIRHYNKADDKGKNGK
ncbi:MAG: hypothetical protein FJ211_09535 [Ignavibacteria bacterium]|nr:hypothetical protein [Ignavibacteria bacterium]